MSKQIKNEDLANLRGDDARFTAWHKSPLSSNNGSCVEVSRGSGTLDGYIGVRDSKNPEGAVLAFTPKEWQCFIASSKDGEFDRG